MKKPLASIFLCVLPFFLMSCNKEASSIGIIGGADGPTAIFVTVNPNWMHIGGLIGVILVAVILYRCKKKN